VLHFSGKYPFNIELGQNIKGTKSSKIKRFSKISTLKKKHAMGSSPVAYIFKNLASQRFFFYM